MSAPDKNAVLSHITKTLAELQAERMATYAAKIYAKQPKIGEAFGDRQLLKSEYDEDGLLLDFYGSFNRWGYEVSDVSLSGSDISVLSMITCSKLIRYSDWCNRTLPSYRDQQQAAKAENDIAMFEQAR